MKRQKIRNKQIDIVHKLCCWQKGMFLVQHPNFNYQGRWTKWDENGNEIKL